MQIAILESDLSVLDCALEMLSSPSNTCFGVLSDESLRELLEDVSPDLVILDWAAPNAARHDTLSYLAKHKPLTRIILCVTPLTPDSAIVSELKNGENICVERSLGGSKSLVHIHALECHNDSYST